MVFEFVRAFRTTTSERFLLRNEQADVAALDIHYLQNATVQSTLIVFEGAGISDGEIPALLSYIDEVLLPEVSLDDQRLFFTVVVGRVLGSFEPEMPQKSTNEQGTQR